MRRLTKMSPPSIQSCFSFVVEFDLKTICNVLGKVKTKWFEIGIQLGIPRSKLLEFEGVRDPLSAVLDYFLQGNVTDSAPISWQSVVAALRSDYVGEPGLADEVNQQYCPLTEGKGQTLLSFVCTYMSGCCFSKSQLASTTIRPFISALG